jgi:uncharacterized protein YxjI
MGLFGRRDERAGGAAVVYTMRERLVDIGDDFWIETSDGRRAFKVDGKVLRFRDTLVIRDANGDEVAKLQERKLRVRDTMVIERPGRPDATIKKAIISPFRERWSLEADGIDEIEIKGNILDHEYEFEQDGKTIAETSKRWLRVRDTYGVEIQPGADVVLVLAATVALDQMAHDHD